MYWSDLGCFGSLSMGVFQMLSLGKTGQLPMCGPVGVGGLGGGLGVWEQGAGGEEQGREEGAAGIHAYLSRIAVGSGGCRLTAR